MPKYIATLSADKLKLPADYDITFRADASNPIHQGGLEALRCLSYHIVGTPLPYKPELKLVRPDLVVR